MAAESKAPRPIQIASGRLATAVLAVALISSGCSSGTPDVESIGLAINTDIQAGAHLELTFPAQPDTSLSVVSTPSGITANISAGPEPEAYVLRVDVDSDTPRGSYNLGISVIRDSGETVVGWPFEVVD